MDICLILAITGVKIVRMTTVACADGIEGINIGDGCICGCCMKKLGCDGSEGDE